MTLPNPSMEEPTDPRRLDALLAPHRDALRGYVHRLIGHRADAEDVMQDVLLKALQRLHTLRDEQAFERWIYQLTSRTCIDHLRKKKRWRPFSQHYVETDCAANEDKRAEVVATTRDPEFEFDVREHIAFCFTCVGRSLPPEEHAAIVLRELVGLSNREAAETLGVTESVLRHRLSAGRRAMESTYEGLCALVGKQGICHQCVGFRNATAPERRGPALPVLSGPDPWKARTRAARERHFRAGHSETLHDLLFERIRDLEESEPRDG